MRFVVCCRAVGVAGMGSSRTGYDANGTAWSLPPSCSQCAHVMLLCTHDGHLSNGSGANAEDTSNDSISAIMRSAVATDSRVVLAYAAALMSSHYPERVQAVRGSISTGGAHAMQSGPSMAVAVV